MRKRKGIPIIQEKGLKCLIVVRVMCFSNAILGVNCEKSFTVARFSVTYSFRPYHGPGVNSAPSENEYQEHFLEVNAAGA